MQYIVVFPEILNRSPRKMVRQAFRGSALVLTLIMLSLITLEVAMLSLVINRSMGESGASVSSSITLRMAAETAMQEVIERLDVYMNTNGSTNVMTAFAHGNDQDDGAYSNRALQSRDPEDPGTLDDMDVTIDAWVEQQRGPYYQVKIKAKYGDAAYTMSKWLYKNVCSPSGTLTQVISGRVDPGYAKSAAIDDTTGRLFFGEKNAAGAMWTWHYTSGLSALVSGAAYPGYPHGVKVHSTTGRVFFGQSTGGTTFWTWSSGTGLSVILSGVTQPGTNGMILVNPSTGRVFFGENKTASQKFWTWRADESKLLTPGTWGAGYGLSQILSDGQALGLDGLLVMGPSNRMFIAGRPDNRLLSWSEADGLSVLNTSYNDGVSSRFSSAAGDAMNPNNVVDNPMVYDPIKNMIHLIWQGGSPATAYGGLWSYLIGSGSIISDTGGLPTACCIASDGGLDTVTGRLLYGTEWQVGVTSGTQYSYLYGAGRGTGSSAIWNLGQHEVFDNAGNAYVRQPVTKKVEMTKDATVTTIYTGSGAIGGLAVKKDTRLLYVTDYGTDSIYEFNLPAGSSQVIATGVTDPSGTWGYREILVNQESGRLYFSDFNLVPGTHKYYTWKQGSGVSVILSNAYMPISIVHRGYDKFTGGSYFVEFKNDGSTTNVWHWRPPESCQD